jgi:hypothetical protein
MTKTSRFSSISPGPAGYAAGVFLVLALVLGGGSRIELVGPVVLRCLAIGALVWLFWPGLAPLRDLPRRVVAFLLVLLALPLVQMIPLPWGVWTSLPGRELAADVYKVIGTTPWQPISLTPERTLNAFFAQLPPLAGFLIASRIDDQGATRLWLIIAIAAGVSAAIGILQVIGGESSSLYFYAITNSDSSVGVFSNANHQALFLCVGIVAACRWVTLTVAGRRQLPREPMLIGAAIVLTLLASIPLTLSRSGAIMAVIALAVGLCFAGPRTFRIDPLLFNRARVALFVLVAVGFATISVFALLGDAAERDLAGDARLRALPQMLAVALEMLPFGSGLGSFDAVFRSRESIETIGPTYLNNAHNDWLQLVIEAGLGALALGVVFVLWWAWRGLDVWRTAEGRGATIKHGRAAFAILGLALMHSAVDYPLRTSAMAVVFTMCAAMLMRVAEADKPVSKSRSKV